MMESGKGVDKGAAAAAELPALASGRAADPKAVVARTCVNVRRFMRLSMMQISMQIAMQFAEAWLGF
jgi:hypothetical protein